MMTRLKRKMNYGKFLATEEGRNKVTTLTSSLASQTSKVVLVKLKTYANDSPSIYTGKGW